VWPEKRVAGGAKWSRQVFEHLGFPLEDEHVRTPYGADVQRLVAGVEDEDLLHQAKS
jgi:hypothetical protein